MLVDEVREPEEKQRRKAEHPDPKTNPNPDPDPDADNPGVLFLTLIPARLCHPAHIHSRFLNL